MRCGVRTFFVIFQISTIFALSSTPTGDKYEEITSTTNTDEPITANWNSRSAQIPDISFDIIDVIDNNTILISDFYYDIEKPDAYFWVGNETQSTNNSHVLLSGNGTKVPIGIHNGDNITLTLPNNLSLDSFEYISIWCVGCNRSYGYFEVPKNGTSTGENKTVIPLQKCCPLNQALTEDGCTVEDVIFNPTLNVHKHNSTHIDDQPVSAQSVVFQPFIRQISCQNDKYPLIPNEDQFSLLQNGSLLFLSEQKLLNFDSYCMESVYLKIDKKFEWITTAILCLSTADVPISSTIFYIYSAGTLLSAALLIATALVFLCIKSIRDTRGKCVIGYSSAMAAAFIFLGSAQILGIEDTYCKAFGIIIQFFLVLSFTWLSLLSWETYYKINCRNYNNDYYVEDDRRFWIYLIIGLIVPTLISIVSYFVDKMPGIPDTFLKPKFGQNACWFDQNGKTMVYFYLPIAIAIVFNFILGILMKCRLVWLENHRKNDISWKAIKPDLKPMYRSCMFVLCVNTLCWAMEMISFLVKDLGGLSIALDIIDSLQGLFIFIIFVLHRPVKDQIVQMRARNYFRKRRQEEEEEHKAINVFETNGTTNSHFDPSRFLTDLRHVDSIDDIN